MVDKGKNIDKLFADGLKNLSAAPSSATWEGIAEEMAVKRKKKRYALAIVPAGIAAGIFLLLMLTVPKLWKNGQKEVTPSLTKNNAVIEKKDVSKTTETLLSEKSAEKEILQEGISHSNPSENFVAKKTISKIIPSQRQLSKAIYTASEITTVASTKLSKPNILPHRQQLKTEKEAINKKPQIKLHGASDIREIKQNSKPANRWSLIGQFTTAFTNESGASSSNGMMNIGGSLRVDYALSKKLAMQTGISFSRYSQDYGSTPNLLVASDAVGNEDGLYIPSKDYATPLQTNAGEIILKDSNIAQEYAVLSPKKHSPTDIMQVFDYIEMPILLRYNLTESKLKIFFSGGIGINWLISNGVYSSYNTDRKIGEISNLRSTNFTSQAGIGMEYQLTPTVKVGIEPRFKYYLNSLNNNKTYNYKPYSIGLQTGIRIAF